MAEPSNRIGRDATRTALGVVLAALLAGAGAARAQILLRTIEGEAAFDHCGRSADVVGDVNRDGVLDFVIGAPDADVSGWNSGEIRIVSGADGSTLFRVAGEATADYLGWSVSRANDVDGDGFPDVIVGAFGSDAAAPDAGRAYVISGRDGGVIHVFDGDAEGDLFGYSVANVGDLDLDGRPDVAVGAYAGGYARVFSGADGSILFTHFGDIDGDGFGCSVAGLGDANGDGVADLAVGSNSPGGDRRGYVAVVSGADGSRIWKILGQSTGDGFGWAVAAVGDVDGDGLADFAAGAPWRDIAGEDAGAVYVFGSQTGFVFSINGKGPGDWFGRSLARVGDLDGDGVLDFAAGAPADPFEGGSPGRVVVLSAADGRLLFHIEGVAPGDFFGSLVRGAGDLDADGFADVLVGAPFASGTAGAEAGTVQILSSAALLCTRGAVGLASAPIPTSVLLVNGETGGRERKVAVGEGAALRFTMSLPPSGGRGRFVVHANLGPPGGAGLTVLPESVGTVCFPLLLPQGASPVAIWNNLGKTAKLGASTYFDGSPIPDPAPAPVDFLDLPGGDPEQLPAGTVVTLQGVVFDPDATSPRGASATNAVVLRVE